MSERVRVDEVLTSLLELCQPLEPFDMPLLDAHDATLAEDVYAGERLVMKAGSRIRSTQIGLAASIGLDHLPTRPHPRVVVISAGPDLVEPGVPLKPDEEYETNSWLLTTAVREVGAVAYRVHSIPDAKMGEIKTVEIAIESSGRHNFGTIGPDKTPVVTLPGDPIAAYISFELLIRPMIRTMLGTATIHRPSVKAKLEKALTSSGGMRSYVRAILSEDGKSVLPLSSQDEQATLSDANSFIAVPEGETDLSAGAEVTVVVLERRYL